MYYPPHAMKQASDIVFAAALVLAGLVPATGAAMGPDSSVTITRLEYGDAYNTGHSDALRQLLLEVEKRTSIQINADSPSVSIDSPALFEHPFAVMAGNQPFPRLSKDAVSRLRMYLKSGGFLWLDSGDGVAEGPFSTSARRLLRRVFPDKKLKKVPRDHVIYKSFYLLKKPYGRVSASSSLYAVFGNDRLLAVLNENDALGAYKQGASGDYKYDIHPGGTEQRDKTFRFGINLVLYALCINYKADQVHVPFILKRRDWKVH